MIEFIPWLDEKKEKEIVLFSYLRSTMYAGMSRMIRYIENGSGRLRASKESKQRSTTAV